jgi:DNA-directed RNA polymerase subunit RPC12/RpoP
MPKVTYDDWIEDDPFHPCLKCGSEDFEMDLETSLYKCRDCGSILKAPTPSKTRKAVKKPFRFEEEENWD